MEDPESGQWEIQEYSPSKEGETSMVKWILNKGYGIGKKMVITGIVISSAPLVLPPLVVFSAMGVAVSVPFGLVFASYACTNKLMGMLLPTPQPPPPLMLEYYYAYEDDEEKEGYLLTNLDGSGSEQRYCIDEYEDDGVITEDVMQEEEEEKIGDVRFELDEGRGVYSNETEVLGRNVDEKGYYTDDDEDEVRLENVVQDENADENEEEEVLVEKENMVREEKKEHVDESNKQGIEVGFELDDVDENVDEKGRYTDEIEEEIELVERENMFQEEEKEQREDLSQWAKVCFGTDDMDENVDKKCKHTNENEVENGEGDALQREYVDEEKELNVAGDEHNPTEEESNITNFGGVVDEKGYEEDVGEYLEGDGDSLEERKIYYKEEEVPMGEDLEEIVKQSTGLLEKIRDEGRHDNAVANESPLNGVFEEVQAARTPEPVTVKEIDSQKLVVNGSKDAEPVGEMRHVVVLAGGNNENNYNSREVEELDLVAREVLEDAISRAKRENLVHSNADVREVGDESGLDLFEDQKKGINFKTLEAGDQVKEHAADEKVDVMALPAFKQALLDSDNAKIASKTDTKIPFRKDILDNEKIWEKIEAMRAIVGFKVARQPTCIGELKALYVFTGVEPPASFRDDSDLEEVNAKLKFLMSIVGVR